MLDEIAFSGSCACGRITYKTSSIPMACACCHCITCRKLSGGPFQAFPIVEQDKITYYDCESNTSFPGLPAKDEGGISIVSFSAVGERAFCTDCHTPLAMRYRHEPNFHSVTLGSVDEDSIRDDEVRQALAPNSHIFTSQQAWWCKGIGNDELRRNERFGGTFERNIKAWEASNRHPAGGGGQSLKNGRRKF